MAEKRKISLVLADVDGTLVTEEKVLTKRAQAAVQSLRQAGIRFAITSGRPPRGMAMLFDALDGYLARVSRTASNFGGELDSLCDAISFGAAPAFLLLRMGPGWDRQPQLLLHQLLRDLCAVLAAGLLGGQAWRAAMARGVNLAAGSVRYAAVSAPTTTEPVMANGDPR